MQHPMEYCLGENWMIQTRELETAAGAPARFQCDLFFKAQLRRDSAEVLRSETARKEPAFGSRRRKLSNCSFVAKNGASEIWGSLTSLRSPSARGGKVVKCGRTVEDDSIALCRKNVQVARGA